MVRVDTPEVGLDEGLRVNGVPLLVVASLLLLVVQPVIRVDNTIISDNLEVVVKRRQTGKI